jgi:hypothetical protein
MLLRFGKYEFANRAWLLKSLLLTIIPMNNSLRSGRFQFLKSNIFSLPVKSIEIILFPKFLEYDKLKLFKNKWFNFSVLLKIDEFI